MVAACGWASAAHPDLLVFQLLMDWLPIGPAVEMATKFCVRGLSGFLNVLGTQRLSACPKRAQDKSGRLETS